MPKYTDFFYKRYAQGSQDSALEIVPFIVDLIKPESVVDVGCGIGTWLSAYKKMNIPTILGIDGSYVNQDSLLIPPSDFMPLDLRRIEKLDRCFDLVQSLEVAEHLPEENAEAFVDFLTELGPAVLFSAAIPGQPGNYHINNQWPEYWAAKFEARGYLLIDCVRRKVWNNKKVAWWYAQNLLLFVKSQDLETNPKLKKAWLDNHDLKVRLRHPKWYVVQLSKALGLAILAGASFLVLSKLTGR